MTNEAVLVNQDGEARSLSWCPAQEHLEALGYAVAGGAHCPHCNARGGHQWESWDLRPGTWLVCSFRCGGCGEAFYGMPHGEDGSVDVLQKLELQATPPPLGTQH